MMTKKLLKHKESGFQIILKGDTSNMSHWLYWMQEITKLLGNYPLTTGKYLV